MAYDRADWHHGGNYPNDLPSENGGTHIGMFLAWVIMNGFESEELKEDNPGAVVALRARAMTGRQFLFRNCDGKLSDVDLNEEVNAFAKYYYSHPDFHYLEDYHNVLADGFPSTYHVNDSWENYDKIAPVITQKFNEWKQRR